MTRYDTVWAVLPDDDEARQATRDLTEHGVWASAVHLTHPAPGRYPVAEEGLHTEAHAAARGAVIGTLIGAVAGVLMTWSLSDLVALGVTGFVIGAFAWAGFGALAGGMWGLQAHEANDDADQRFLEVAPDVPVPLVEVHDEHVTYRAHRILERHGAVFLDTPEPAAQS